MLSSGSQSVHMLLLLLLLLLLRGLIVCGRLRWGSNCCWWCACGTIVHCSTIAAVVAIAVPQLRLLL
jgi:hypothetical protein